MASDAQEPMAHHVTMHIGTSGLHWHMRVDSGTLSRNISTYVVTDR